MRNTSHHSEYIHHYRNQICSPDSLGRVLQVLHCIHQQKPDVFDCVQIKEEGQALILWSGNTFKGEIRLSYHPGHLSIGFRSVRHGFCWDVGSLGKLAELFEVEPDWTTFTLEPLMSLTCIATDTEDPLFDRPLFVNIRYHFDTNRLMVNGGYGETWITQTEQRGFESHWENRPIYSFTLNDWPIWVDRHYGLEKNLYDF